MIYIFNLLKVTPENRFESINLEYYSSEQTSNKHFHMEYIPWNIINMTCIRKQFI